MNRKQLAGMLILLVSMTAGCTKRPAEAPERIKPVKVMELKKESTAVVLQYTGIIEAEEMRRLSFKSSGKLKEVFVKKGDKVEAGQLLAALDTEDLEYSLKASEAQMKAALAQYRKAVNGADPEDIKKLELNVKKAQDSYNYTLASYKRIEALYNGGAVSKDDLDKAKLELDVKEAELQQAKEAYNQAKDGTRAEDRETLLNQAEQARAQYEHNRSLLDDASLKSDAKGSVVDILYKKGEMVSASYPVIVLRSESQVVNVGLSSKDVKKVAPGTEAVILVDGQEAKGRVEEISDVPDSRTMTYNARIYLESMAFSIGDIADVKLIAGSREGIWVPITAILSDGSDYVYIENNGRAEKRKISIVDVSATNAMVEGVRPGERLVVEGMKSLRDGDRVARVDK
jgi:multidrug resistance efflux pump